MKKAILLTAALCVLTAGSALAAGVNLSWDNCTAGLATSLNKTSTCLANNETAKNAFASYVLPADADALNGNDIVLDIIVNSATLPCWWNFTTAPRTAGYGMAFNTACPEAFDYWGSIGTPAGGPAASLLPSNSVPRVRIKAPVAIDALAAQPVPASTGEIYSFTFNLKHGSSFGGACQGCQTAACLVLNLIRVTQTGFPYMELTTAQDRNFVFWQGGIVQSPGCPLAVPTQNKTWGSVKALYR
jgi:hypothetical protein